MSLYEILIHSLESTAWLLAVFAVFALATWAFVYLVRIIRKRDAEFFALIDERNSEMLDDDTLYSMEEVMARMNKTMRVGRKYYSRNYRRGGLFRFEHPVSVRRGQKFLGELSPGLPDMINSKITRQKPGRIVEQKPAKSSRYRTGRKYRRYFGNNR